MLGCGLFAEKSEFNSIKKAPGRTSNGSVNVCGAVVEMGAETEAITFTAIVYETIASGIPHILMHPHCVKGSEVIS